MIRPETNRYREALNLDGIWRCRMEGQDGRPAWENGFDGGLPIAVPGSWNEQLAEAGLMNHTGAVWYTRDVLVPDRADGKAVWLHFGSADYVGEVFWNGEKVGESGALMLPFEIEVTGLAKPGQVARLVVRVEAALPEHGPMQRVGLEDYRAEKRPRDEYWPAVRFDFFPFGGLNRSVHLCLLPRDFLPAPIIRTGWKDGAGTLNVTCNGATRVLLDGVALSLIDGAAHLDDVSHWSPDRPQLYTLAFEKCDAGGAIVDRVTRRVGFRSLVVEGQRLLLNGEPIILKGFGKHEDTPIAGRGVNLPSLVKDFGLLKWIGANSVRTSHYPYDESFLDMADEQGLLVISELFSVNLDFRRVDGRDLAAHKAGLEALMARDGHHACVVAWSLSNEPGYLGEVEYAERSAPYWRDLFAHARKLDMSRPLTVSNVQYAGEADPAFAHSDFISINRYYGWYHEPGQIERARDALRSLFDRLVLGQGKPIFVSEFGADAIAGLHATTDQLWTEEFQADLIEAYWQEIIDHPAVVGGHVWNFADFRTAQHGRRVVMNRKGVFTRERDPKRAAFTLKRLWTSQIITQTGGETRCPKEGTG